MLRSVPYHFVGRHAWKTAFRFLLPSFVADLLFSEHRTVWKIHPTSYLDGMRGIASILVFVCHYTENNYSALIPSYGISDRTPSGWIQLPYVRIVFSGRPMVRK